MESKVIFRDLMDNDPADHNALQDFAQRSLDNVVADAITPAQRYAGFTVTKTGPTTIRVAPGRLYSAGHVFARQTEYLQDFVTSLPVAGKKIIAVVVWGNEVDTDLRPREFLINEETRASEPRVVAVERARVANVQTAAGAEAPDPTPPLVDVAYTVVAHVLLTTTGIDTVTMIEANELPNLGEIAVEVDELQAWRRVAEPQISTLASDMSRLANQFKGGASQEMVGRVLSRLAVLEEQTGIPSNAADSDADFYLDADESELTDPNFLAKVEEGIRFAPEAQGESALQIFDPLNPRAVIKNGIMFPAYDRELWLWAGPGSGEVQVSAYTYQSHAMVQKTMSRQRTRHGAEFVVCTNSDWWQTGRYDPLRGVFEKDGETFEAQLDLNGLPWVYTGDNRFHAPIRLRQIWVDTVTEPYWDRVVVDHTVQGSQIAQTWLQGQDIWLDSIGLWFSRIPATGNVTFAVVEVSQYGLPDLTSALAVTTMTRDQIAARNAANETLVVFQPTYLQAGKRYALVVTSGADYWLATVAGDEGRVQGTFFYVLDGAYAQGDATKDLGMAIYRAKFRQPRTIVELSGLQLSGGILAIDILADTIVPASTTLSYEIQVGGIWYPLAAVDKYVLGQGGNIPPLLPLRAVFNGTSDMQPCVKLLDSRVRVSRPRTVFRHITKQRTLPAASSQIRVIYRLEGWDDTYHTAACRLLTGAGFATEVLPSSVSEVVITDNPNGDPTIERTAVFNLGSAISSYKIDLRGTTTTPQRVFHVAWRKDYAL